MQGLTGILDAAIPPQSKVNRVLCNAAPKASMNHPTELPDPLKHWKIFSF